MWPNIPIYNAGFASDFYPKSIDMTGKDPLSGITFHEHYLRNQSKYIPYYLIAVITTRQSSDFKIYDGVVFYEYSNNPEKEPIQSLQSIHYFALNCFEFKKAHTSAQEWKFNAIDLTSSRQTYMPFPLNFYYPRKINFKETLDVKIKFLHLDQTMIKGLDSRSIPLHDIHLNIAENIENKNFFSGLEKKKRSIEVIKWIWCSLQNQSNSSSIAFYNEKLNDIIDEERENKNFQSKNKVISKL